MAGFPPEMANIIEEYGARAGEPSTQFNVTATAFSAIRGTGEIALLGPRQS